ncbi:unnamed protein product [Allacma fusca]|uniref:Uncharacterized protein n=1 Tax=Allacma fusca TaxID=39272 RepID=A0A8J2JCW2_9HEXA|nr:unnamed protein product [Allacma fusca]
MIWISWRIPFGILVEQDSDIPKSLKPLVVVWSIAMMAVVAGYRDKLIAGLTFPQLEFVPMNLNHLRESLDHRILLDGFLISSRLNNSQNPDVVALRNRFKRQPTTVDCVMETILQEKTVCVGYKPMLLTALASNFTINYDLNPVVVSQNILPQVHVSVVLQKYSYIVPGFERITGAYREAHLYEKSKDNVLMNFKRKGKTWLDEEQSELKQSLESLISRRGNGVSALKVRQLVTPLTFYSITCVFSIGIFMCEIRRIH